MPRDPVCGRIVDKNTPYKEKIGETTYYFCSAACIDEFRYDTDDYIDYADAPPDRTELAD